MTQRIARDRRRGQGRLRPSLMALEDRRLLSTFTVDNTLDDGSTGSLRWAVGQANSAGGDNTIDFDAAVFSTPQTITLSGTQLELTDTTGVTTIAGPAGGVTVSGGGASRVFQVDPMVSASISGLTITDGSVPYGYGAGLLDYGTASLTNCTVSGNAGFGSLATGTHDQRGGVLTLTNTTVSGNSEYGGVVNYFGTSVLTNTIVAGNGSGNGFIGGTVSGSNNLIGNGYSGSLTNGVDGNIVGVSDPGLAPLGNYGGTAETVALLPGSPAIDAGTSTGAPADDERGMPQVGAVDIGAFESGGFTITATSGGGQMASAAFSDPLVATVTANNPLEPVAGGSVTFTAPSSGASATISGSPATIGDDGTASVTVASNFNGGSYDVVATTTGDTVEATFGLTNDAVVSIAVSPGSEKLAEGVSGQYDAVGTFTDGMTHDLTDVVAWSSSSPTVATIDASGLATGVAVGSTGITATLTGVTSADDPLTVIAASFVVNTTGDASGFYTGTTSLREAIEGANVVPGETITFDRRAFASPQTITLGGSQLELSDTTGTTTIKGPAAGVTISGGGLSRVFQVDPMVSATFSGLTISGGQAGYGYGGGLFNEGTATLTDCTVSGNTAGHGGGVASGNYNNAGASTTLVDCLVSGNLASTGIFEGMGGGLINRAELTMTGTTVSGNIAKSFLANGGGLVNDGTATLTNCSISGNSAIGFEPTGGGGGVSNGEFGTHGPVLTMTGCSISDNSSTFYYGSADGQGGGFLNYGGSAALTGCTVSGNTGGGVATLGTSGQIPNFFYPATSRLANCTISGNTGGSGLETEFGTSTAINTAITGNSAVNGGGVSSLGFMADGDDYGTTNLILCTVSGNTASGNGGGIFSGPFGEFNATGTSIDDNNAADGGGVFVAGTPEAVNPTGQGYSLSYLGATAALSQCTISGNSASGDGGGVDSAGLATTTLSGCTIRGNTAVNGGGVATEGATGSVPTFSGEDLPYTTHGSAKLDGCTVVGNTASGSGGGLFNDALSTTSVLASEIIGNSAVAGGGISSAGMLTVRLSSITKNLATSRGGGISATGGTATITGSSISNNQVNAISGTALGGGIDSEGTILSLALDAITSNLAEGSTALGGGLYCADGTGSVLSCSITGNQAVGTTIGQGGGIFSDGSPLDLGLTSVKKNKATTSGDNIFTS